MAAKATTEALRVNRQGNAITRSLEALEDLTFEERIRTIRVCDFYGIANVALYQGDGTFKSNR